MSGGSIALPQVKDHLEKHRWLHWTAMVVAFVGGVYLFISLFVDVNSSVNWAYERITIGPYIDRNYSVSRCDQTPSRACVQYGGVFGEVTALAKIRKCGAFELLPSSQPQLHWTSLWITNIYSFAPGGGGPGGGLIDDVLKVGGWGDWYFSLVKFELPSKTHMNFAGVLLFVQPDEHETVPLFVDRLIEPWKWDLTKHIWWRDRPGGFPIVTDALPAPEKTHWYVVEITKLYNQWVNGEAGNFGFQIRPSTNYGSFNIFSNNLAADQTKIPFLVLCPNI
jgi:hypothetical protein